MKDRPKASNNANLGAVLQPGKVAELVRQLAEAQFESRALRERIELYHHESNLFSRTNADQQESPASHGFDRRCKQSHGEKSDREIDCCRTVKGKGGGVEIPEALGCVSDRAPSCQNILPVGPNQVKEMPRQVSCPSDVVEGIPLNAHGNLRDIHGASSGNYYWKKKYLHLKRLHEKTVSDNNNQLLEVQELVRNISGEQDALEYRHELRVLQQKLDNVCNERLSLESHIAFLKEEVSYWRERYLLFVEQPAAYWYRIAAPKVETSMEFDGGCKHKSQRQSLEGLNQTNLLSKSDESGTASVTEGDTSSKHGRVTIPWTHLDANAPVRKGAPIEQQRHHLSQRKLPLSCEGGVSADAENDCYVGSHGVRSKGCSIGVQVGHESLSVATQTMLRSPWSVNDQQFYDECFPAKFLSKCSQTDVEAGGFSSSITAYELEDDPLTSSAKFFHCDQERPATSCKSQSDGSEDCVCHASNRCKNVIDTQSAVSRGSHSAARVNRQLPKIPVLFRDQEEGEDDSLYYRRQLERASKQNKPLWQAIAELQRQVQRTVRTPHH
ncbi:unnamed protein product [Trypanosoma congolense IL3000]|uniref:WGS project CAEQ00000000 data, annotated contig 710 n=1 Tax=Trypanosoma congolense (strain IL3000) TaxID=1068625 RepID=F9WHZ3_TRYCI|nr:unnamed protein product [Trypanosoma congolense IL3000]